jgi:putative DNA primase/helicase
LVGSSIFKQVTGGDALTGELKYGKPFTFDPYARLVFSSNKPPKSADASSGFFDRWLVVPFDRSFRGESREVKRAVLDARLADPSELSGVLNRALHALPHVRRRGLSTPDSCSEATIEFRAATDPFAAWLDLQTIIGQSFIVEKASLRAAYRAHCQANDLALLDDPVAFTKTLVQLRPMVTGGQRRVAGDQKPHYFGIGLKSAMSVVSDVA